MIIALVATQGYNVIGKVVYFHLPGPRVGFYYGMSGMCVCASYLCFCDHGREVKVCLEETKERDGEPERK